MARETSSGTAFTLVLHGTFSAKAAWWRLAEGGTLTFADRLENELAKLGFPGSVWQPALDAGFDYRQFSWSGANRHRDRVRGGRKLAKTVGRLADSLGCTPHAPLTLNIVAHSHGGNVALEVCKRVPESVRLGRVVLLGTPLVVSRPSLRWLVNLIGALVLLWLAVALTTGIAYVLVYLAGALFGDEYSLSLGDLAAGLEFLLGIVLWGWLLWIGSELIDRVFVWIVRAVRAVMRSLQLPISGQIYGPSSRTLKAITAGRGLLLLTSSEDEADLLLQLSTGPRRLYVNEVRSRTRGLRQLAELVFLRPFAHGILRLVELLLERYALGLPWIRVLSAEAEIDDGTGSAYPATIIERRDVTPLLLPVLRAKLGGRSLELLSAGPSSSEGPSDRGARQLRETISTIAREVSMQVRLRHSMYYESEDVVKDVATEIASSMR